MQNESNFSNTNIKIARESGQDYLVRSGIEFYVFLCNKLQDTIFSVKELV